MSLTSRSGGAGALHFKPDADQPTGDTIRRLARDWQNARAERDLAGARVKKIAKRLPPDAHLMARADWLPLHQDSGLAEAEAELERAEAQMVEIEAHIWQTPADSPLGVAVKVRLILDRHQGTDADEEAAQLQLILDDLARLA